jgi:ferredoxin-NADP reductase
MYGTVPELAAKANFAERDIYISGPDDMIVKTARVLKERGAQNHLIHYDLNPEAAQAAEVA